jgi:hypothetical protein
LDCALDIAFVSVTSSKTNGAKGTEPHIKQQS